MFYEDGWIPLTEVTGGVFRKLQELQAAAPEPASGRKGLRADLAISVWDICESATKIGVIGAGGEMIPASKDLVAWADPVSLSNEHLNLRTGTVGSSTLKNAEGKLPSEAVLRARYGPFVQLPVVLPVNNVQSSMTFLEEELHEQRKTDPAVQEVAAAIVAKIAAGAFLTREIARQDLGPALSRRKFKIAWSLASAERPELREPRRWQGL